MKKTEEIITNMANQNWYDDKPTEKQVELFNSLKAEFNSKLAPETKGQYREAIAELLNMQKTAIKYNIQRNPRNIDWMAFYDDDYLGDQGIFPGY